MLSSLVLHSALATSISAQPSFTEGTLEAGLGAYSMERGMGSGVSAADFDGDGDIDLFLPTRDGIPNRVYRNRGDGTFEEVALSIGLGGIESSRVGLWFDADGDGDLDLVVAGDYWPTPPADGGVNRLGLHLQQPDGTFQPAPDSGVTDVLERGNQHRGGLAAGDLDGDGDLDLAVALWGGPFQVFENDGAGAFTEVACSVGVPCSEDTYWQPVILDLDADRVPELFVARDFDPNVLMLGNLAQGLVDFAPQLGLDNSWNDMGIAIGDVDSDGDFDLYVTNIYDEAGETHNELFTREADGTYSRSAQALGVENGGWGWGATFADLDLDGDLDLAATNGWRNGPQANDPLRIWVNNGPGQVFTDLAPSLGIDNEHWGSAMLALDVEGDGDLDLLETARIDFDLQQLRLLKNELPDQPESSWVVVVPRGAPPNRHAIGALVAVETGDATSRRLITAGTSFLGQEPAEAHFGLGGAAIQRLTVTWPNGETTRVAAPLADRRLNVDSELLFAADFQRGVLEGWDAISGGNPD